MTMRETEYGFEWGPALVERCISDVTKGWIIFEVTTNKEILQIYVTKTGKIRVFGKYGTEWKPEGGSK